MIHPFTKLLSNKPENPDEDAQGKNEQQHLSFWNCSQPEIMSKEKGSSIKIDVHSNGQKGSNRRLGFQELMRTLLVELS